MWLTNGGHYVFRKRGIYYFSRRVPADLKHHYRLPRIVLSLRTKSETRARAKAAGLSGRLEEHWVGLRLRGRDDQLAHFLCEPSSSASDFSHCSHAPLMSEACALYTEAKGRGRTITFVQAAQRALRYLFALSGDKPIDTYTRSDANHLRDKLFERSLSRQSVKRTIATLRAIVNFTSREHGIEYVNAFSGLYLGEEPEATIRKRQVVPLSVLRRVQKSCMQIDDDKRWLIALITDTGMRLSEAAGLIKTDICLDGDHPHITLKAHPCRRLKTSGSERLIPLVGVSLWACQRAFETAENGFLFPRYCDRHRCKSNSASGALNKWLGPRVPEGCVVHSFRHSFRDRLRAIECPSDIADRLGGWKIGGVGEGYGEGYPLEVLHRWMKQLEEPHGLPSEQSPRETAGKTAD